MNAPRILSIRPNRVQIEWDAEPNATKYKIVGAIAPRSIAPVRRKASILTRANWSSTLSIEASVGGNVISSPGVPVSTQAYSLPSPVSFDGFLNNSMLTASGTFGGRSVLLATKTGAGAYITVKENGVFTGFDVPELPNVSVVYDYGSVVMRSESTVLILTGSGTSGVRVYEIELVGTPVSSVIYRGVTTLRANVLSRRGALIHLMSGADVASCYEAVSPTGVAAFFWYRPAGSTQWGQYPTSPLVGPAYAYATHVCMAQHPVTGDIYHFAKQDGANSISRLRLTDTGTGLAVKDYDPTYITTATPSDSQGNKLGPNGEFPPLRSAPNPMKNSIILAFADENSSLFNFCDSTFTGYDPGLWGGFPSGTAAEFSKGARINCVSIAADGTFQNNELQEYIERTEPFSMVIDSAGRILVHFSPLDMTDWTRCDSYVRVFDTSWGPRISTGLLNWNAGSKAFIGTHPVTLGPDIKVRIQDAIPTGSTPPPDTTGPMIIITSPVSGSMVSGVVTIATSASDNVGVTSVSFLRGSTIIASDTTAPYSCSWDSRTAPNGVHNITAVAKDAAGNTSSATVSISVNNPITPIPPTDTIKPTVRFVRPFSGASLPRGSVSVEIVATDNVAVSKIELYIDNSLKRTVTGSTLLYQWNTKPGHQRGSHTLKAKAFDSAGNVSEVSIPVTVN